MPRTWWTMIACAMGMTLAAAAEPTTQPVDTVGPNDLLCIGIWDIRPTGGETLKTVRVDPMGYVSLYYVGQVKVAGITEGDAEAAITRAFELQFGLRSVPVSVLRLGPRQDAEPTVAAEPNARPTQQVPQRRR